MRNEGRATPQPINIRIVVPPPKLIAATALPYRGMSVRSSVLMNVWLPWFLAVEERAGWVRVTTTVSRGTTMLRTRWAMTHGRKRRFSSAHPSACNCSKVAFGTFTSHV